ncbi:hypothetical protein C8R42DRAFT_660076 [Lentinula raphanica]|nr:hypothetical protein C8R42DRAFT_660076 [Lentinula raphanica]
MSLVLERSLVYALEFSSRRVRKLWPKFFLGGVFVLLQYLGSFSLLRVDWARMGQRFESLFYTTDAAGTKRAPTIWSAWNWLVDFLTADFQPRASFLAGLALGLRIG